MREYSGKLPARANASAAAPHKERIDARLRLLHNIDASPVDLPWHYHDVHEIYYCGTDGMRYLIGDTVYELGTGDMLVLNAFDVHRSLPPDGAVYERYMVLFLPELIEPWNNGEEDLLECFRYRDRDFSHVRQLSRRQQERFIELYNRGARCDTENGYGAQTRQRIFIAEMLLFVNDVFRAEAATRPQSQVSDGVNGILRFIDDNILDLPPIAEVARLFGFSKNRINDVFKSVTSFTIKQYVIERRIQIARIQLSRGCTVTEACEGSGFGDLSHFVRTFKARTGISPGRYAKEVATCIRER